MDTETIRVPISATYQVINGEVVKVSADYRDIPVDTFAQLLIKAYCRCNEEVNE